MTAKRKTKPATKAPNDAGTVIFREEPGKTRERILADVTAQGTLTNAHVMATFAKPVMGELHLAECVSALRAKAGAVNRGDLSSAESMLIEQAAALNAIFGELTRRSAMNMGEYLDAADRYMRLALKAQSQCRATLETLATIKAGPAIFARQANIAHGPQQVNNGVSANNARAGETESAKTELLGASDGERLDTGTAGTAGRSNPALETVEAIDGATNRRG
ncbi:MAG: hypothetical protein WCY11_03640 [Novosphingobium sp.]